MLPEISILYLVSCRENKNKKELWAAMVRSLKMRLAFCSRLANRADFPADRGLMEEKFLRIMGGKNVWTTITKTRTSWSPVCCVS